MTAARTRCGSRRHAVSAVWLGTVRGDGGPPSRGAREEQRRMISLVGVVPQISRIVLSLRCSARCISFFATHIRARARAVSSCGERPRRSQEQGDLRSLSAQRCSRPPPHATKPSAGEAPAAPDASCWAAPAMDQLRLSTSQQPSLCQRSERAHSMRQLSLRWLGRTTIESLAHARLLLPTLRSDCLQCLSPSRRRPSSTKPARSCCC